MKKVIKTLALIAIGVAIGRVSNKKQTNKLTTTIKIADLNEYKQLLKTLES